MRVLLTLTIGAIWTCPVGVAGAGTTLLKVGAVARALVRAHRLQDFTVVATPARVAVALTMDAHAVAGAGWVQAIRCREMRNISLNLSFLITVIKPQMLTALLGLIHILRLCEIGSIALILKVNISRLKLRSSPLFHCNE